MTLESVPKRCESYPFKGAGQERCERGWGPCSSPRLSRALTGPRGGTELPSARGAPPLCSLCPCLPPRLWLSQDSQLWGTRSKGDLESGRKEKHEQKSRPTRNLPQDGVSAPVTQQSERGQEARGGGGRMTAAGTGASTCGRPPRATLFLQLCDPGITVPPPREETEAPRGLVTCARSHSLGG